MFNHISLGVSDLGRALAFYDAVMATIGHERYFGDMKDGFMAYGGEDCFFVVCLPLEEKADAVRACSGTHICFSAPSQDSVDAFYRTALAHGGSCAGAPGIREEYAEDYYAAFVLDPDGHKIEAVTQHA